MLFVIKKLCTAVLSLCGTLVFVISCSSDQQRVHNAPSPTGTNRATIPDTSVVAKVISCTVLSDYPHDTNAFTQGLTFTRTGLVESTGGYGSSEVRLVTLNTGISQRRYRFNREYFGEGSTVLNGRIYAVTWLNQKGFVFDERSLNPIDTFTYHGEGWGLTNDGKDLVMSNGSSTISWYSPENMQYLRSVNVTRDGRSVKDLNELEWIEGKIWANVWQQPIIVIIDPATGVVNSVLDCSALIPDSSRWPGERVLNGIAYDSVNKRVFVTGKLWPKLYEISNPVR